MSDLRCGCECYFWRDESNLASDSRCVFQGAQKWYPVNRGELCDLHHDLLVHQDGVLQDRIADATAEREAIAAMLAAMPKEAGQGA